MQTVKEELEFIDAAIQDVIVYPIKKFNDDRGWLAELFRQDDLPPEFYPVMSYISVTAFSAHPPLTCGCGTSDPIRPPFATACR
jgi:hypothetical protein